MITRLRTSVRGQFIPITAMVMASSLLFSVALVDVYKVTRAKLKVQNLADAVALNLASQQAQHINVIVDRNEWLNHLYPDDDGRGNNGKLPGISFVAGHTFTERRNATSYAQLVATINDAQYLFMDAYNAMTGAADSSNLASMWGTLVADIPELKTRPTLHVIAWNKQSEESSALERLKALKDRPLNTSSQMDAFMHRLQWRTHDLTVRIKNERNKAVSFSQLIGRPTGWMELDKGDSSPLLRFGTKERIGVGVIVTDVVEVMGKPVTVSARSAAYIVDDSGDVPKAGTSVSNPTFSPTFWVKLASR